ncbi:Pls/PosA family non-ribosomal peptide synthetase [Streptomyces orinoci]|uniref:Pls/PosA family non-ribosomal peptide synthetase n=2 Tax=Streptomyces orinoci TaxID=67339 RepID=A0ABV3K1X8_STRON|nr:Pls/PosA family non-ribosomal peptide synthetase [Streptomyces orinoci]
MFAEVLADLVSAEQVPADSHFFDDLGADSMVMARFCARVRKRPDLPSVSMKDIYRHSTVRSLATAFADTPQTAPEPAPPADPVPPGSTPRYLVCGTLQFLVFLAYSYLTALAGARGYQWVADSPDGLGVYGRSVLFGGADFLGLCMFPVLAKWILVGRWRPGEFPVWSLAYLRFWTVKLLVQANPAVLFVGTPLYVLYLRALGARIGGQVTILSRFVPVCTDLLTIGSGTVIRKDSYLLCYRAEAGRIQTGPVTIGRNAFIGEQTVLDIHTSMGDGAQLGHASALQHGEAVPAGRHWHGSPAQPTELDYLRVAPARCGAPRRAGFALFLLARTFLLTMPLWLAGGYLLLNKVPSLTGRSDAAREPVASAAFWLDALLVSAVLFGLLLIGGLLFLATVPRLMHLPIEPDRVYPLYGYRYAMHRSVSRLTNSRYFTWLFGDSSYIVHYLTLLGYDLSQAEQTGSNFGIGLKHESPYLSTVGRGTMVADGLSLMNADYSSTSFKVSRTVIGAHNFLGNHIAYPSGGRTGENCLIATKAMVPLDGELREGVGLLGSPSFEIPRTVERDTRFDHLRTGGELESRLAAKNRYNLRTIALVLLIRWGQFLGVTALVLATAERDGMAGQLLDAAFLPAVLVFTTVYYALMERCLTRFRPLEPTVCSIYDRYFWHHERLWKVPQGHFNAFNGTPFKNLLWRMLGVRVGRRVFDDGCDLSERTLTTIGDDCTLGFSSKIQCHSQEDGTFKSDRTVLGAGCTLGINALVHYGVTMGEGAVLAPDSFLMKGEEVPAHARWGGNPASAGGTPALGKPSTVPTLRGGSR